MAFLGALLPLVGTVASSLLGSGSGTSAPSSGGSNATTTISYQTAPPIAATSFDWTTAAPQWAAIGAVLLLLLLLGAFEETRPLAIAGALLIGVVLVLGKVQK